MIECMKKIARKQNMVGEEKVTVCMSSNERDMCKKRDTELMKEKEKKSRREVYIGYGFSDETICR